MDIELEMKPEMIKISTMEMDDQIIVEISKMIIFELEGLLILLMNVKHELPIMNQMKVNQSVFLLL